MVLSLTLNFIETPVMEKENIDLFFPVLYIVALRVVINFLLQLLKLLEADINAVWVLFII